MFVRKYLLYIRPICIVCFILMGLPLSSNGQSKTNQRIENLVKNGTFEDGNINFSSDFEYNFKTNQPGQYAITDNAFDLNREFRNPIGGDHTYGNGYYLMVNSNDQAGLITWQTSVQVVPNTVYRFTAYFCNLYYKMPAKTSFAFDDGDVKGNDPALQFIINGAKVNTPDRDIYRLFRWIQATTTWYSGTISGSITIGIENSNTNSEGNDLAIDDISFTYVETMPEGYVPPKMRTIMSAEYRAEMAKNYKPSRSVISFADIQKGDEFAPGIFQLKYRNQVTNEDSLFSKKGAKFQLHNLIFNQSETVLLASAQVELERLSDWLKKEPSVRIRIEGHTDNIGNPELNVKLSQERVFTVKAFLMNKGIAEDRIETIGYGGTLPIADNKKEETRKSNRRVEFEIID